MLTTDGNKVHVQVQVQKVQKKCTAIPLTGAIISSRAKLQSTLNCTTCTSFDSGSNMKLTKAQAPISLAVH